MKKGKNGGFGIKRGWNQLLYQKTLDFWFGFLYNLEYDSKSYKRRKVEKWRI